MNTKPPYKTLFFIMIFTLLALFIAMPSKVPVQFKVFNKEITYIFERPALDFNTLHIPFRRDLELRMGLDIQGGTRVTLQTDMSKIPQVDRETAFQSTREIIARRVDLYGVSESTVQTSIANDQYRIIVELPGVTNSSQAVALIGTTAQLDFREEPSTASATSAIKTIPTTNIDSLQGLDPFANYQSTGLTGKDLQRSAVQFSNTDSQPVVTMEFTTEGKKKFAEITQRNIGKRVIIYLDNTPVTAPMVNEPILTGTAEISGGFTVDAAKQLSIQLNAGALPVPIQVIQQQTIGASLGRDAVTKTARAGLIGVGLVALFMILLYGWKGVLADIALAIYAVITLAIYKLVPVTLTLPGIAGLMLSIGMAVDSNILIFERMKEELRAGRPFGLAMKLGFGRAWDSIKDANVATLFTCFILFNPLEFSFLNRSGMVRGFAFTLAIGIILGLFTGIVVTRTLLRIFLKDPAESSRSLKQISRGTKS